MGAFHKRPHFKLTYVSKKKKNVFLRFSNLMQYIKISNTSYLNIQHLQTWIALVTCLPYVLRLFLKIISHTMQHDCNFNIHDE